MLLWTQGKTWVGAGIACAVGFVGIGLPAEGLAADLAAKPLSAAKKSVKSPRTASSRTVRKIVRAQDNPFEEEWEPAESTGRARVTPVSATEPESAAQQAETAQAAFEAPPSESVPATDLPDAPSTAPMLDSDPQPAATDSAALKRLKERSAKERWEKLHAEWVKNRKERSASQLPRPQAPAKTLPTGDGTNEFEPELQEPNNSPLIDVPSPADAGAGSDVAVPVESPDAAAPSEGATERPIRAPRIEPGRVRLQSQQKPRSEVKTDDELNKLFQNDDGARLAPPVKSPTELPKISEIIPVPKPPNMAPGRQVPEQNAEKYIRLGHVPYEGRLSPEFVYSWEATNFKHRPLYFEDATLERYGHTLPPILQPIVSIGKFTGQLAFLPYQMTLHPPCSDVSPLGWYAPGDCVPYRMHQLPLNAKAAAVQATTIIGSSYLLP